MGKASSVKGVAFTLLLQYASFCCLTPCAVASDPSLPLLNFEFHPWKGFGHHENDLDKISPDNSIDRQLAWPDDDGQVEEEENPWAKYRWDLLNIIPRYTAPLSMFGSLWIIIEVLRDKKKRRLSYHRLVFVLSLFDFVVSTSFFSTYFFWGKNMWESGSVDNPISRACETTGFFTYWFSLAIPMYNAALANYFNLTIKYGWREDRVRQSFERYVHWCVPLLTFVVAIVPIPLDLYNFWTNYCWPSRRAANSQHEEIVFWYIFWVTVFVSTLDVTYLMCSVFLHVYRRLQKSARHGFEATASTLLRESSEATLEAGNRPKPNLSFSAIMNVKLLKRVRMMALLYTLPFYITWFIPTIWQMMSFYHWKHADKTGEGLFSPLCSFVLGIWMATFLPLQGFFNWLIYMIPRFQHIRDTNKSISILRAVAETFARICISRKRKKKKKKKKPFGDSSRRDVEATPGEDILPAEGRDANIGHDVDEEVDEDDDDDDDSNEDDESMTATFRVNINEETTLEQ